MNNALLEGKRVVVTGGASGIGASVADVCASTGARVAVLDLDLAAALETAGRLPNGVIGHAAFHCDVSDARSVEDAFARAEAHLGGIDAVVSSAGIWRPGADGPITEVSDETWDRVIAVNLTGTFYVCRAAVSRMKERGGSIVTVASVTALTGWEKVNAYTASKGGIVSLSRALAIECGPKNVRVNCICPGVIETPMTKKVLEHSKPTNLPIGRLGRPEDVGRTAAFLCSDWSGFTTGSTVVVDGGFSAA